MKRSALAISFLSLCACTGPYSTEKVAAKEQAPPLTVVVERIAEGPIPEVVEANGELFAEEQANVSTKVPGRVERLNVDLGSIVKAGDVIAELEKTDYQFRVRQAEALVEQTRARLGLQGKNNDTVMPEEVSSVREAVAALKEARFIMDTTARLAKEGVVSKIDFEKAQVRAQGAEAHYQGALSDVTQAGSQLLERRAQLDLARQQLTDATIRAPFTGAITKRVASLGEYLGVNAIIVTLVRQHPLRVRLEVPERQAARVRQGQRIDIRLEGSQMIRAGRVVRLSPAIEAQNRTLLIEGEIPNEDGVLRPGSFVIGVITVDAAARGITVPAKALVSFAGTERVYIVKDGILDERVMRTGRRLSGGRVEVLDGLREGDVVVAEANDRMAKGRTVRVN
ncbi:MAG: efflux RND transporter periplasmic adaptor subunit [Acidobacteriota bacterium]